MIAAFGGLLTAGSWFTGREFATKGCKFGCLSAEVAG
jgi:hypothetical protein